jgi:hypothetical protein
LGVQVLLIRRPSVLAGVGNQLWHPGRGHYGQNRLKDQEFVRFSIVDTLDRLNGFIRLPNGVSIRPNPGKNGPSNGFRRLDDPAGQETFDPVRRGLPLHPDDEAPVSQLVIYLAD